MTPFVEDLDDTSSPPSNEFVRFGNGHTLPVTNVGTKSLSNNIHIKNVLVVPHLTKRLLSISKLTHDSPIDVLFSNDFFHIQDRKTKEILAKGTRENGLYVLREGNHAFIVSHPNRWRNHRGMTLSEIDCPEVSTTTIITI
ncbi:hypothetical protein HanPI659440_Chr12g0467171 [Helianthus annuus]|nr:hypothetical protein HanPI659440_Chr12g0467171 [Helianthus annuus]